MTGATILLGLAMLGQGAAPADDLDATVRRLVRQLDDDQLAQRDAAEAELLRLGAPVLSILPQPNDRTPAETKERLVRIRARLERAAAEAAVEASRVTLKNRAIPLSQCLEEIHRQTGNRIEDLRERFGQETTDPTLSVNFDNAPFWTALDDVLTQAKLSLYPFGTEHALGIVARSDDAGANDLACTTGPLRFIPLDLTARRSFRHEAPSSLALRLGVVWEPRLAPISLKQRLADLEVVDDKGKNLTPDATEAEIEAPISGEAPSVELTIPLALPPRDTREIARLSGRLMAVLPGRVETFRFDKLLEAKDVEKRSAGVTVTLVRVRRNGEIWEVWIRVRFDQASGALESYRGWVFENEAYLETADGKRIDHDGFETSLRTETEVGLAYLFDLPEPPAKCVFVYKTPTAIVATEIKYELTGLKLP
ncbi:MAG: hypothetical protein JW809_02490 [Pirellulales bacterium]|nr:hypothetical protein [Pirellulales bacterium]